MKGRESICVGKNAEPIGVNMLGEIKMQEIMQFMNYMSKYTQCNIKKECFKVHWLKSRAPLDLVSGLWSNLRSLQRVSYNYRGTR